MYQDQYVIKNTYKPQMYVTNAVKSVNTLNLDETITVDENNNLKAAIMFKSIKSEYNKNANNYYENMKGESSLFIDNNIPVYQIIFIPTAVRHKKSNGEKTFETPPGYAQLSPFIIHPLRLFALLIP